MPDNEFEELFQKYLDDSMTPQEFLRWKQLMGNEAYHNRLDALLDDVVNTDRPVAGAEAPVDLMYRNITQTAWQQKSPMVRMRRYMQWAAAVLVLAAGAYIYTLLISKETPHSIPTQAGITRQADAEPGKSGAVLTLADGSTIVLDSLQNGIVATQYGTEVILQNGQVAYSTDHSPLTTNPSLHHNTITTTRGRQFQLLLPDGTRAWLNAASSLTYPTAFTGAERQVQVTGEVYFEVAKQQRPFKVQAPNNTIIEVTGTHFNINAYPDESSITTTLTEGAVNVLVNDRQQPIRPGQQAKVNASGAIQVINNADTSQALAWKNGVFDLNNADLPSVMRQLARWYDVTIVYGQPAPAIRFGGKMQRNLKLSQVLNGLSGMGVQFRIEEGKKLVIN